MPKKIAKKKSVLAEARSWAAKKKLFGAQAFLRYVILNFAENLNQVSDEFVFKGGNLLWVYIATPRATIDLDLATLSTHSHSRVRQLIEKACNRESDLKYTLHSFKEIEQEGKSGAAVSVVYKTDQGASNRFDIDIIYALDSDFQMMDSPVHSEIKIRSASLENIIVDKLAACHRFGAGNTRMKDYDDLWRLSQSDSSIDEKKLKRLLKTRKVAARLNEEWINPEIDRSWVAHWKKYQDLPVKLEKLFKMVNKWLEKTTRV
jgi:hypothetical protein